MAETRAATVSDSAADDSSRIPDLGTMAYDEQRMERLVSAQLDRLRAEDEAKRRYAAERRGHIFVPQLKPLTSFLETPDEELRYRIDGLLPVGARIMLAAQFKAGKSTLVANLIRSLVDGEPFLGVYPVQKLDRVVLIDDELDERTLRRWLREQGIRNTDAVRVIPLRGKTSSFGILDPDTRTAWATALRGAQFAILDCLRPVLDALGLDENHDAGRFLTAFDELTAEAGIPEAMIVQHMGHQGERSRGDSRLQDWPDVTWKLVRQDEDPASARYFSAFGRDVDVKEAPVFHDEATRRYTLGEGSRKETKSREFVEAVVASVKANPGQSKTTLRNSITGDATAVGAAISTAVEEGLILAVPRVGKRGGGNEYHPKT